MSRCLLGETAGAWIVGSAHGNGQSAVAGDSDLSGRGGRDLGGGEGTGEGEGYGDGTDDELHLGNNLERFR